MELSNKQQKIVQQAKLEAANSIMHSQHGSVIIGKKVIVKACNTPRRYLRRQFLLSCHSEVSALYKLRNIKGTKVGYVGGTYRPRRKFNRVQAMS